MTAVVAFAASRVAFISGDTRRAGAPFFPASKVHAWSDRVLFGQAGNGQFLSRAIGEMQGNRSNFGDEVDDLLRAFEIVRNKFYQQACNANPNNIRNAGGTLLIATAGGRSGSGELRMADFATDKVQPVSGPIGTIGVANLSGIAAQEWQKLSSSSKVSLDRWAADCIVQVVDGSYVDWPIEFLIARPSQRTDRIVVKHRALRPPIRLKALFSSHR